MSKTADLEKIVQELQLLYNSKDGGGSKSNKCLPPCKRILMKCPPQEQGSGSQPVCEAKPKCNGSTLPPRDEQEDLRTRYANFYNGYNLASKNNSGNECTCPPIRPHRQGQGLDGKDPNCPQFHPTSGEKQDAQCKFTLKPPEKCDSNLNWTATYATTPTKKCTDYKK